MDIRPEPGESTNSANLDSATYLERILKRGHGDDHVSFDSLAPYSRGQASSVGRVGRRAESSSDFLTQNSERLQALTPPSPVDLDTRGEHMMALERKRRLTSAGEDTTKRRPSSFGPFANRPMAENSSSQDLRWRPSPFNPYPGVGNSRDVTIDLSSPWNSPHATITNFETQENNNAYDIVLPRWQPDNEVSSCPICGVQFTFFNRKHHCRKCGRVVCGNCSPHRITIPKQFIVQSPQIESDLRDIIDLTGDNNDIGYTPHRRRTNSSVIVNPGLGGGAEVRLCNPCVPDPNIDPPRSYFPPPRFSIHDSSSMANRNRHHMSRSVNAASLGSRSRSTSNYTPGSVYGNYHGLTSDASSHGWGSGYNPFAIRTSSPPRDFSAMGLPGQQTNGHTSALSTAESYTNQPHRHGRYHSSSDPRPAEPYIPFNPVSQTYEPNLSISNLLRPRPVPSLHRHHASTPSAPLDSRYRSMLDVSTPPASTPQLNEEDECPVCHNALPPKGPNGDESSREAHVEDCINSHFAGSKNISRDSQPRGSTTPTNHNRGALSITTPPQAGSSTSSCPARMLVYRATEKDCVASDGTTQECVICLEDFEAGEEMGRLECLCNFHRKCIRAWWEQKGMGACPTHQEGIS
ncbi:MAG: hypothetical protein M1834_007641 [Cirrosporium novae-zelandiae]|nr:MAG: hypothetical protein M1834_007641 [Cirrosporium novae-zelandiae]